MSVQEWRLRWIWQWFETNARYNFSVLQSISQFLASVVTGLRPSVDMRPSTSPSIKAYKRCSKRAVVTAPPKASSNSTDSTLQETARSTHWETLYLCGGVCRCQSGFLVEDDWQFWHGTTWREAKFMQQMCITWAILFWVIIRRFGCTCRCNP